MREPHAARRQCGIPVPRRFPLFVMADCNRDVRRWLQALEEARFGVWELDPRLETVHYSPQWKARMGFPRLHAADSTSFWRCRVHPDDVDGMLGSLRRHLDGDADSYAMQFRLRSNGSGYRAVLSRGRVLARDARGHATRMVGTMIDLTARPVARGSHGLVAEEPQAAPWLQQATLHARLGLGKTAAANHAASVVERIDDLLDIALRESSAA